jgi:hypothetical protein
MATKSVLAGLVLLLSAGSAHASDGTAPGKPQALPAPTTEQECLKQGGSWGPTSMFTAAMKANSCTLKTRDAGKACSDGNQCEGFCIANDGPGPIGRCSSTTNRIGCYREVEHGAAMQQALCYD